MLADTIIGCQNRDLILLKRIDANGIVRSDQLHQSGASDLMITKPAFEAALAADGYVEIETKSLPPRPANGEHGHHYTVKGLVLDGVFSVVQANVVVAFQRGEIFSVPAGDLHCEEIGPEGAQICVGRKY